MTQGLVRCWSVRRLGNSGGAITIGVFPARQLSIKALEFGTFLLCFGGAVCTKIGSSEVQMDLGTVGSKLACRFKLANGFENTPAFEVTASKQIVRL